MKLQFEHSWELSPAEAIELQNQLRRHVRCHDRLPELRRVAGVDVGFEQDEQLMRAAVAVLSFPELQRVETAVTKCPTRFPYIPGLLSFRELPALLAALDKLDTLPDLILCDGQGIAHPRRFGIACHLGVLLDLATIGVAKTRLIGHYREPADDDGKWSPLLDGEEIIGAVLRTRKGVKPVYVSAGHRLSLESAIALTMACVTRYRLPETTRQAHHLASVEKDE